jgi:DNA-binding response OmpR family regulator
MTDHVLLVDDEPAILNYMRMALEDSGDYRVSAALGEGALALLDRDRPALVILDAKMPGSGGITLAMETLGRDIPLLMTDDEPRMVERMRLAGLPLLRKPFLAPELLAQVHRAIDVAADFRLVVRQTAAAARAIRRDSKRSRQSSELVRRRAVELRQNTESLLELQRRIVPRALSPEETAALHAADAWGLALAAIKDADDEQRFSDEYQLDLEDAETELYCCVLRWRLNGRR